MNKPNIVDDIANDAYEEQPIESFGKEMLYRMGWKDNQPLGKDRLGPINPIDFKPRNNRLGLGAEAMEDDKHVKKYKEENKVNMYGAKVRITHGKHKGMKGRIVERNVESLEAFKKQNTHILIELKVNKQTLKIECDSVRLRSKVKSRSRSRSRCKEGKVESNKKKLNWISKGLVVRIVNKTSKYYIKKAQVEDVIDPFTFSLLTEDKLLHLNFSEADVETIIPKIGENVIILANAHKGETGKLIERNKITNKVIVQLHDDLSLAEYTQDEVCQYQ